MQTNGIEIAIISDNNRSEFNNDSLIYRYGDEINDFNTVSHNKIGSF